MKTKVAIAISTALMTASISAMSAPVELVNSVERPEQIKPVNSKQVKVSIPKSAGAVFVPEKGLDSGKHRYFVRLAESPVALYQGGIEGFKATSPAATPEKGRKLNVNDLDVKAYANFLESRQASVISKAKSIAGEIAVKQQTKLAFNGLVVEMTQAQAMKLATISGVAHIKRETLRYPHTDSGPAYIKAPAIWDGTATGTAGKGEGMVVGIIDTGINTDHPSFADVGGDGYDHTNPWGEGVYSGDCATEEWAQLCNDKLIGVHSYPAITDQYADYAEGVATNGEDHNGHGSHTAGTSAGNVLVDQNVPNVDGEDTGVVFESMAGVAPHANIVSYQVCLPGENDAIRFSGCFPSLTVLAVEHAIESGVDALNYSIGGGSSDPWNDADALSFLSARKAGIHVATSAGNSGPGPETVGSPGDAPWITTVAAYTHDRTFTDKTVGSFEGGDTDSPADLTGKAMTGGFTGKIVYAGDYTNSNDPDGDPAQCLQPFPAETFAADTIVVCDRGAIARVDKGRHAAAGGAAAMVLANVDGGATSVVADAHMLPAIHIDAASGNALRTWLASGEGHMATITGSTVEQDESAGSIAAEFTSRGPNKSVPDVIAPSIAAPGVSIFAAYADDQPAGFKENPDPSDFGFLSGTSMASPHVAGALTLLAELNKDWTPAEAQSALMLTANQKTMKEDGTTASDFFDMGAGYANVTAAAQTGLVMNETYGNYMSSNPSMGGMPSNINLPTMANSTCVDTCTWTRTVKATKDASWMASTSVITEGLTVTVSPADFTLAAGEEQEITVTADVTEASAGWNFGNVVLTSNGLPEVKLPVAAKANGDNLPASLNVTAQRGAGSITYSGFMSKNLSDIQIGAYDKATDLLAPITLNVPDQSFDYAVLNFPADMPNVVFSTSSATAPDVDVRILDATFATIGRSAGPTSDEAVAFTDLPAGTYYFVVDGYTASAPGATDEVTARVTSILVDDASKSDHVNASVKDGATEGYFDIVIDWSSTESTAGIIELHSGDDSYATQLPFSFTKGKDDVATSVPADIDGAKDAIKPAAKHPVTFNIEPNFTSEDKVYTLTATLSDGQEIADISHDGVQEENNVTWTINREANNSAEMLSVSFNVVPRKASTDNKLMLSNTLAGDTVSSEHEFDVFEVAPTAQIEAPAAVQEGKTLSFNGSSSFDDNNDAIASYNWKQLSGSPVSFSASSESISFTAPAVSGDNSVISFELTVTDENGNTNSTIASTTITNKKDSGSFGWLLVLASPLLWLRRRK